MYKEYCEISTVPKIENPSAADRWAALAQKPVCTAVEQPNKCNSEHQSTPNQGQCSIVNRQPTVKKYLDRITVAGLHNYLYAIEKYEKVTWNLTFFVAIVGTMFYFVTTIRTYLEFTIVLDIQEKTGPADQLPNVYVCMEAVNVSFISDFFEKITPKLLADRRIRLHAKRAAQRGSPEGPFYTVWNSSSMAYDTCASVWNPNTTSWEYKVDDIVKRFIHWSKHFSIQSPLSDSYGMLTGYAHVLEELLYIGIKILGKEWLGYKIFYEDGMFSCESVLKNCTLNGITFDCCAHGSTGYSQATNRCFRLDVNRSSLGRIPEQLLSSSVTLSFETTIDSVNFRELHSAEYAVVRSEASGISVSFGPRMPGLFEVTQTLAPSTVSTITVRGIKKNERTGCVKSYRFDPRLHIDSHPLIINYFKEMMNPDQYTVGTCEMGKLLDTIYIQCGCVPYYDTIRPHSDSVICTPTHMFACLYRTFHDVSPNDKPPASVSNSSAGSSPVNAEDEFRRSTMTQLKLASASECLPLCETWTYDYRDSSMIAAGPEGDVSRYFRNKVTVIFDPEYRVETEVYKMDYTTLIASLGDGFGLILGFSAVTLIQLPIWTIAAIVLRRKLNKVSPLQRQRGIHDRRAQLHNESVV